MDKPPEITDLAKVVDPYLNGSHLISYTSRYLTKLGDNYGSIMLAISAIIRRNNGIIEELPLVAKLPPLTNDLMWDIFKPEMTSLRENAMYMIVANSVRQLQLDNGTREEDLFDVFAKFYGCRISLCENATVLDRDAVLILENLQTSGYRAGKRHVMFDYDHAKIVLKYVAKYHALPIALRKHRPNHFHQFVLTHFKRFDINKLMNPEIERQFREDTFKEVRQALGDDIKSYKRCKELRELSFKNSANFEDRKDDLFTTIAHFDLWINNIMIQYDENGTPNKVKIVDFQISQYESLMHDLIFFLLSSVETKVLQTHFTELLKFYYKEFIDCLEGVRCSTEEYSFEKFMEEMKGVAPNQIYHAIFMARIILAEESNLPNDFKDVDLNAQKPLTEALLQKYRDIVKLSQQFGFFWEEIED